MRLAVVDESRVVSHGNGVDVEVSIDGEQVGEARLQVSSPASVCLLMRHHLSDILDDKFVLLHVLQQEATRAVNRRGGHLGSLLQLVGQLHVPAHFEPVCGG